VFNFEAGDYKSQNKMLTKLTLDSIQAHPSHWRPNLG